METIKRELILAFENNRYEIAGFADFPDFDGEAEKKIKSYFRQIIWTRMDGATRGGRAIILYLVLRAAQLHYGETGFYDNLERFLGTPQLFSGVDERTRLGDIFRLGLKEFRYKVPVAGDFTLFQCPGAGAVPKFQTNITPILIHAGLPNSALNQFIPLVARNTHNDFQGHPQWLYDTVNLTGYPLHRNLRRLYHLGLGGTVEVWETLTEIIKEYWKTREWNDDATFFLDELPKAVDREEVKRIIQQEPPARKGEIEVLPAPPKIRFHPETRRFEIVCREKPDFNDADFLSEISASPYRARIRRPPTENAVPWKSKTEDAQFRRLSFFYEPENTAIRLMIFDTKSYRLISPEEIERRGLTPTRYCVFSNARIELGEHDAALSSEWDCRGWYGAVVDFSEASHQSDAASPNTRTLKLRCGNVDIRLKWSRLESVSLTYLDADDNPVTPRLPRVSFLLPDSETEKFGPLFNGITKIRFGGGKVDAIQLARHNRETGLYKISPGESHGNVFDWSGKLQDGIYQVRVANRSRVLDYFTVLDGFAAPRESYSADGEEFWLELSEPTTGMLKGTHERDRKRRQVVSNGADLVRFVMPTRYPSFSLDWEWKEPASGSFTMNWPLRGLRWRIVSKSGNSHEEDWSSETLVMDMEQVSNIDDSVLEIHFPDTKEFRLGGISRLPCQTDFGGAWSDSLTRYQTGEFVVLERDGQELPLVLFMRQPFIESFGKRTGSDGVTITWEGNVPSGSVLLLWEPSKPGSTFREFPLKEDHLQTRSVPIGSEYEDRQICCTIAVKREKGLAAGYYCAMDWKEYRNNKRVTKIALLGDGGFIESYLTLFILQLFESRYKNGTPPDVDSWLRGKELKPEMRSDFHNALATFVPEMNIFAESPLLAQTIGSICAEVLPAMERFVRRAGKWLPLFYEILDDPETSARSVSQSFLRELEDGVHFGWIKPYQIAEADYLRSPKHENAENSWGAFVDSPYPLGYFRDLWLISSPYWKCRRLTNCKDILRCDKYRGCDESQTCEHYTAESKLLSHAEYNRCQLAALERVREFHAQYGLPDLESLAPMRMAYQIDLELANGNLRAPRREFFRAPFGNHDICLRENTAQSTGLNHLLGIGSTNYLFEHLSPPDHYGNRRRNRFFELLWKFDKESSWLYQYPWDVLGAANRNEKRLRHRTTYAPQRLKALTDAATWRDAVHEPFRKCLNQWNYRFSPYAMPELDDDFEKKLREIIATIVPVHHPMRSFLDYTGKKSVREQKTLYGEQVPALSELFVDDTTRLFWLHAVLERLFVNDTDVVRAAMKTRHTDGDRELEEFLRKHDAIFIERFPLQYHRGVQMLAELAVRVGWLGGIGIVAQTIFDTPEL